MPTVKVYRSGAPTPPVERGCERESYLAADAVRPAGRQGRMTAIFASPTLAGVTRWVRGNALAKQGDVRVRELTVDPTTVYVYSVSAWECVGFRGMESYWATGMPLSEWLEGDYDASDWELLLGENDVKGARMVGDKRVVAAEEDAYYRRALERELKAAARATARGLAA